MKRKVILLLVLILIFSLSGCKKEELSKEEELEAAVEKAVAEALSEIEEESKPKVQVEVKRKDNRTLQQFADAYISEGAEVDMEEKPMYGSAGEIDAVIFLFENSYVKIYEFDTVVDLRADDFEYAGENGRFGLDATNEKAIEIFLSVE